MNNLTFILLLLFSFSIQAQELDGVFIKNEQGVKTVWIAVDGYLSITEYKEKEYLSTKGGPVTMENGLIEITYEYNSEEAHLVGQKEKLTLTNQHGKIATKAQDLDGLWQISHRKVDKELVEIQHTPGRKTIKILKDGYFQWVALDTEKKEVYGTGGGNYLFQGGNYIEVIQFFSKDNARVGSVLSFNGKVDQSHYWHHSGKSSTGKDIYEIWILSKND